MELQVRHESSYKDEIEGAVAHDLISDVAITALRVPVSAIALNVAAPETDEQDKISLPLAT